LFVSRCLALGLMVLLERMQVAICEPRMHLLMQRNSRE
jgi:hypothetical protein